MSLGVRRPRELGEETTYRVGNLLGRPDAAPLTHLYGPQHPSGCQPKKDWTDWARPFQTSSADIGSAEVSPCQCGSSPWYGVCWPGPGPNASSRNPSMHELQKYVTYLASDEASDSEDNYSIPETCDAHNDGDITIDDCFAWAVPPFIISFQTLASTVSPASKKTLQEYFNSDSYECQLGAADDCLVLGSIDLLDPNQSFISKDCCVDRDKKHSSNALALFPTFPISQIEILSGHPDNILDDEPRLLRAEGEV